MPGNFKKTDLRIKKTYKALITVLIEMLNKKNFSQITVNDLCEEALISRATFYVHFKDKYDLLEYWLSSIKKDIIKDINNNEEIRITINEFISENKKVIANIFRNANTETLTLVENFISSIIDLFIKKHSKSLISSDTTVLINFCTGGIVNLLSSQMKKQLEPNEDLINSYIYDMIRYLIIWDQNEGVYKNE